MDIEFHWSVVHKEVCYNMLVGFWKEWDFPIIPYDFLPETIYTVWVEEGQLMVLYYIPVFHTNSGVAWLGFPTGNKQAPKEYKKEAFGFLLDVIEKDMKNKGYCTLLTTSMNPKLMKEFTDAKFVASDQGTTFYTKNI